MKTPYHGATISRYARTCRHGDPEITAQIIDEMALLPSDCHRVQSDRRTLEKFVDLGALNKHDRMYAVNPTKDAIFSFQILERCLEDNAENAKRRGSARAFVQLEISNSGI